MLPALYIIKHCVRNEWQCIHCNESTTTTKKYNAAPVFCKMQTQCPKNNSYLAAVIIIGNTSENSSPSCV